MRERKCLASAMAGMPVCRDHSRKSRKKQCKMSLGFVALYRDLLHISAQSQWPHITIQNTAWKAVDFVDWPSEYSPKAFLLILKGKCWHDLQRLAQKPQETEASFLSESPKAISRKTLLTPIEPDSAFHASCHSLFRWLQAALKPVSQSLARSLPCRFYIAPGNGTFPGHPECAAVPSCQHSLCGHWQTNHGRWGFTRNCSRSWMASGYLWHKRQPLCHLTVTNEGLALCKRLKCKKNVLKGYKSKEAFCTGLSCSPCCDLCT